MQVRPATAEEVPTVMTVFDSAMLETDLETIRAAARNDDLLVAVESERVLGACLLVGEAVDAIAVRPGRRGQGIGRALVEGAAERRDRLVADFDPRVRPFWASVGFEIESAEDEDDRHRGVRGPEPAE